MYQGLEGCFTVFS